MRTSNTFNPIGSSADIRSKAETLFNSATGYNLNYKEQINILKQALEPLDLINSKQDIDIRLLIKIIRSLAHAYYNDKNFQEAINAYNLGIIYLPVIQQPNDEDFRTFIMNSIDACDAYLELNALEKNINKEKNLPHDNKYILQAAKIFNNAIPAFTAIKEKSIGEEQLGNILVNLEKFYYYYDSLSSHSNYIHSLHYQSIKDNNVFRATSNVAQNDSQMDDLTQMFQAVKIHHGVPSPQPLPSINNPATMYHHQQDNYTASATDSMDVEYHHTMQIFH